MRFILLCFVVIAAAHAVDPPLPADVQKTLDEHAKAVEVAKKAYDAAVAKADTDATKKLQGALIAATKKGDLDTANAIKGKLDGLTPKTDVLGNAGLVIVSAKYGVEGRWFDATKFVQAKVKDGALKFTNDEDGTAGLPDPAPGATKVFLITYTLNGAQKVESFTKHAVINLGG